MEVQVVLDRVGAVYKAGEVVSGVVVVHNPSSSTHSGIHLNVEGTVGIYPSVRGFASFEPLQNAVKPVTMLSINLCLSPKGEKLPAGSVELPFQFTLASQNPKAPLQETYQGVYVSSLYSASATVSHFVGKTTSDTQTLYVIVPGQGYPNTQQIAEDHGVPFRLSQENIRTRKINGDRIPKFLVEGKFDRFYNDIDIPLAGWINVRHCEVRITSLELQFIRVEAAATADGVAREATEIQNIQIGDGDVMRGMDIPIYMFFPRWYTSPNLKLSNMKAEFEVNIVITLEDQNQITQNTPIRLYRSPQAV